MKRLTQKDEQGNMLKELNEEQCKHRWIPVEERDCRKRILLCC